MVYFLSGSMSSPPICAAMTLDPGGLAGSNVNLMFETCGNLPAKH